MRPTPRRHVAIPVAVVSLFLVAAHPRMSARLGGDGRTELRRGSSGSGAGPTQHIWRHGGRMASRRHRAACCARRKVSIRQPSRFRSRLCLRPCVRRLMQFLGLRSPQPPDRGRGIGSMSPGHVQQPLCSAQVRARSQAMRAGTALAAGCSVDTFVFHPGDPHAEDDGR